MGFYQGLQLSHGILQMTLNSSISQVRLPTVGKRRLVFCEKTQTFTDSYHMPVSMSSSSALWIQEEANKRNQLAWFPYTFIITSNIPPVTFSHEIIFFILIPVPIFTKLHIQSCAFTEQSLFIMYQVLCAANYTVKEYRVLHQPPLYLPLLHSSTG